MIKKTRPSIPESLKGRKSPGELERNRAISFFSKKKNRYKKFPFEAYKKDDIKESLEKTFQKKCSYCESRYSNVCPVDIEHYRPKGAIMEGKKNAKPGYYWLAADWKNLLPACPNCNRRQYHTMHDASRKLTGKGNHFPIANPDMRAKKSGEERNEKRLLIHPCEDDPRKHIEFNDEGLAVAKKNRRGIESIIGATSIEVYALQRMDLLNERKKLLKQIKRRVNKIKQLEQKCKKNPQDGFLQRLLDEELDELADFLKSDQPYISMVKDYIKRNLL